MVKIKAKCIQPHKTLQQLELYLKNLVALLSLSLTNIILTFLVISKHKGISKAIRCFILSLKNDIALQITHTLLEQLPLKLVQMPPEGRISHKWTEGTKLCKAESSWASLAPNLYQSPWPGSIRGHLEPEQTLSAVPQTPRPEGQPGALQLAGDVGVQEAPPQLCVGH